MPRRKQKVVVRGWIVWAVAAAVVLLAPIPAGVVEAYYSWGVYPRLQNGLTLVSNMAPVALLDVLLVLVLLVALARLLWLIRTVRANGVMAAGWEAARRLIRAASILIVLFMCLWGWNYRRVPLEAALGTAPEPSVAVLTAAVRDANALAASLRPRLGIDHEISYADAANRLREPMRAALGELRRDVRFRPGRPKYSMLLTPFFTAAGVNGMLNPFALESIVHSELLPVERGFVLAHEWAHLAGHADEAEASAVGWFACMRGGPVLAYSASLYLILEAGGALPGEARSRAFASLDAGVREDLAQIAARMQEQQPQVQRAAFRVYDEYLRANQVEDGTASYGRALSLILSPPMRGALDSYRDAPLSP